MNDIDRTALYRMFSKEGDLLYVGITKALIARLGQHDAGKEWYHLVSEIRLEHFPTRAQARRAEVMAIQSESPAFNLADRAEGDEPRFAEYGIDRKAKVPAGMQVMPDLRKQRFGRPVKALQSPWMLLDALLPDPGVPFHLKSLKRTVRQVAQVNGMDDAA